MCQRQLSDRDQGPIPGVGGRVGRSGKSGISHGKGEGHVVHKLCLWLRPLMWVRDQWQFC